MKTAIRVALAFCLAAPMGAATFSDSNFSSGWTTAALSFTPVTATVAASVVATGGSGTPPFRQVQHNGVMSMFAAHLNSNAVWDPSVQGAITSLDYSYDIRSLGTGDMMYALLLYQNGAYYATQQVDLTTPAWTAHSHNNPTMWTRITGPPGTTDFPDFSCKGSKITFGYLTRSNLAAASTRTSGLDRWEVTVHADPPQKECCMWAARPTAECAPNGTFTVSTTITNTTGHSVLSVLVAPPPGATYTVTPNVVNGPIPNGGSINVTVTVSGAVPGQTICLRYYLQSIDPVTCCVVERCFELPECACMEVLDAKIGCDPDPASTYLYTFTLHNLTSSQIDQVFVLTSAGTVTPQLINIPIPPNGSIPVTLHLNGVSAGTTVCIVLQAYGKDLDPCCMIKVCVTVPEIRIQCD